MDGMLFLKKHERSLFEEKLLTLQRSLDPDTTKVEGDWDVLKMEQSVLKVAPNARGVVYFLAVPYENGRYVLR